jgi:UDP-N-acetylglucosamine--N-acetylmuramyl-(pentapeptide) pyrophosphoryl-undecaprenol N-acetylglucosamine transferase
MCGKGHLEPTLSHTQGYCQFEYIGKELRDIFALSDLVISRAGANSICELLALHKPNLLIPLSAAASRGDQILNAKSFEKQGFSMVLKEEDLTADSLVFSVEQLYANREQYRQAMTDSNQMDSIQMIVDLIKQVSK